MRVTKAVLPTMRRQGTGRIINMSSILGLIPSPYNAIYSSTKHALEGYSESLDHELRTLGIRVVLVEPGYTNTAFEKNKTVPDERLSIYDSVRTQTEQFMLKAVEDGDAPEIVAEAVLRAATAVVPNRRYPAGKLARQVRMLRRFVPESAFDKSLRKQAGLPV
jgi:short-subunit dehydrogenase